MLRNVTSFGTVSGAANPVTPGVIAVLACINLAAGRVRVFWGSETITGTYGTPWVDGTKGLGGIGGSATPAMIVPFGACWQGASAEAVDTAATITALHAN